MVVCSEPNCGQTHPPNWLGWVCCSNWWRCGMRRCFYHQLYDIVGMHVWYETTKHTEREIESVMVMGVGVDPLGPETRFSYFCKECGTRQSKKAMETINLVKKYESIWKNYNSDADNVNNDEPTDDENNDNDANNDNDDNKDNDANDNDQPTDMIQD